MEQLWNNYVEMQVHLTKLSQNIGLHLASRAPVHNTWRSASTTSLVPNRNRTVRYGKRLFDTSTAVLWNNLPNNIKCATSIIHYKNLLKQYMSEL